MGFSQRELCCITPTARVDWKLLFGRSRSARAVASSCGFFSKPAKRFLRSPLPTRPKALLSNTRLPGVVVFGVPDFNTLFLPQKKRDIIDCLFDCQVERKGNCKLEHRIFCSPEKPHGDLLPQEWNVYSPNGSR